MRGFTSPTRLLTVVLLTVAWCGLWKDVSVANVLSGLAVAVAAVAMGGGSPIVGGIRPRPLVQLLWLVFVDLARSTVAVAVEIITPTDRTDEVILDIELDEIEGGGRYHLLLLTVAITLTPGTAVIDADHESGTLRLHLLHRDRKDATIAHAHELVRLACEALPPNVREVPA